MRLGCMAVAVAGLLAPVVEAQDLPPANLRWLRVEGPNFTVISDAKEKAARQVLDNLEVLHAVLGSVSSGRSTMPVRTFAFAFRNGASLNNYSPWPHRQNVAGFFVSGAYRNYMGIDASTLGGPVGVAYHEYLHVFANANFPEVPLWFNEGLAEYYSTFRIQGRFAHIGRPRPEHVEWLRSHPPIPLEDLLEVTTSSHLYNESSRAGAFYAQSWAMVHYLFADEGRAGGVARFLDLLSSGQPVQSSFIEAFGQSFGEFEKGLRDYIRSRRFTYLKTPVERLWATFAVETLDVPVALTILGDFAANLSPEHHRQARLHFEESLRRDPKWGPAHVGLGWLCHRRDDLQCAVEQYRQAAVLTAEAPIGLYLLAEALIEQLEETMPGQELTDAQHTMVAEARHSLARAVELDPGFAPARISLGWTYLYDGDPNEGLEALARALELLPADAKVYYGLAVLSARRGDFGRAWAIADELAALEAAKPVALAQKQLIAQVRVSVVRQQINLATLESNARREEKALEILAALRPRLEVYRLAGEMRFADNVERHARHNLAVRRVDEALELEREGEARQALEILDAAISDLADPQAILRARDVKQRIEEQLER